MKQITARIKSIPEADRPPTILLQRSNNRYECHLVVTEYGYTRSVRVSAAAAEIMIANGFGYGN